MSRKVLAVAAIGIFAGLLLGSPLGATSAAKKPIKIDSRTRGINGGSGNFFLYLAKRGDLGKVTFKRAIGPGKTNPFGQQYSTITETDTLKGKNGTLVIRAVGPGYDTLGFGSDEVWEGTWSIVSGTGDYSGLRGGGRLLGVANQTIVTKRSTGFVQP